MSIALNATFLNEIEKNNIHGSDFELLIKILNKADNELGGCFASNKKLAESLHMNWATVSRKISKLIKKGLLTVKYLFTNKKRGKKVVVNGKEYLVYRLLTPAHQVKTVHKTTQNHTAKAQKAVTENNQCAQSETVTPVVAQQAQTTGVQAENNVAHAEKQDNQNQDELRQKAYELAQKRSGIKNIDGYVKGMLNQWHKQGIFTIAQLKEKQGFLFDKTPKTVNRRYGKRNPMVEKEPKWLQEMQAQEKAEREAKARAEANKTQAEKEAEKAKVQEDIDNLFIKLGIKTPEQIAQEKAESK